MSVISSYPQLPSTRNALTPRDVASYVTNPAYANDAALDTALTALTATVAALPTVTISASVPNTGTLGYFWLDSSTNNQLKVCNTTYGAGSSDKPGKWTSIRDNTTLSVATAAQSTADTPSATTSSAYPTAYTQGWIWVNSSTGAAYICKETYTVALPEGSRASKFTAMVDSATASIASAAAAAIADMGDDEKVTPDEKLPLQREWSQIQTAKGSADTLATNWSLTGNSAYTAMVSAYNNLNTYLNTTLTVFSDLSTTTNLVTKGSTRSEWNNKWAAWYSTHGLFLDAANTTVRSSVVDMADDEKIAPSEKLVLQREWAQIQNNKTNLDSQATSWSLTGDASYLAAVAAYSALDTYLNTTLTLFVDVTTATELVAKSSTRNAWNTAWSNWYNKYTLANTAMTESVKSAVDDMGADEKITPSEKLVLKREWTQIQENKAVMDDLATDLSLTGNANYTAAVSAYNALNTYLNTTLTLFASMSTTTNLVSAGSSRTGWNAAWALWYSTSAAFGKSASTSLKSDINLNQSDDTITEAEARDYKVRWNYEVANHTNHEATIDVLVSAGLTVKNSNVTWTAYDAAYDALNTYLNATLNLFANSTWPFVLSDNGSSASDWKTKWETYTDAERAMSALGNTTLAAQVDELGNDNVISQAEKRTVKSAWGAINGGSLTVNSGDGEYHLLTTRAATLIAAGNSSLSTPKGLLDAAYTALYDYLITTLSGATGIFNSSVDTPVDDKVWDGAWNGYYTAYANLDAAATAISDAEAGLVGGLVEDETITAGKEKQDLIELFENIKTEKTYLLAKAAAVSGVSTTAYTTAFSDLQTYLYGVFTNQAGFENQATGATGISRPLWASAFANYYEQREALESQIIQTLNNNMSRDSAAIPNMATDGTITVEEKYVAQQYWATIYGTADNGEHDALRDQATNLGVLAGYITAFNEAYNRLGNFIDTSNGTDYGTPYAGATALDLFADMGSSKSLTASQQAEWQTVWNGYYTNRDAITLYITNALQTNLDGKLNRDGTLAMTGTLNMGGYQTSNLLAATANGQAVRYNEYNTFLGTTPIAASTASQIHALTEKATPVAADELLMEDSSASWAKKKVTASGIREYLGMPAGAVIPYAGSSAPTGWLMANGATVSQTTYAALYAVIGHTYGADPGGGNFILPNLQNRVPVCKGSGTFASLAGTGGAETHTLTSGEVASHAHTIDLWTQDSPNLSHNHTQLRIIALQGGGVHLAAGTDWEILSDGTTGNNLTTHSHHLTGTSDTSAIGGAHNNLQPYIVLNYIIKT